MFPSNRATLGLVVFYYREKQRFSATDMLDDICVTETGNIFDGRTDTRIDVGKT